MTVKKCLAVKSVYVLKHLYSALDRGSIIVTVHLLNTVIMGEAILLHHLQKLLAFETVILSPKKRSAAQTPHIQVLTQYSHCKYTPEVQSYTYKHRLCIYTEGCGVI